MPGLGAVKMGAQRQPGSEYEMTGRMAFQVRSLVASFVVIAICETFFLLDALADMFYLDIGAPWLDHDAIELVTTVALAFALIAITPATKHAPQLAAAMCAQCTQCNFQCIWRMCVVDKNSGAIRGHTLQGSVDCVDGHALHSSRWRAELRHDVARGVQRHTFFK